MKIQCLGDSLSHSFKVQRHQAWPCLVAKKLGCAVESSGICGDTTSGMLSRLSSVIDQDPPDIVVLLGGTNDIFLSGDDRIARVNMGAMTHQIVSFGLLPIIILPPPIVPCRVPENWRSLIDFNSAVQALQQYRTWLAMYTKAFHFNCVDFHAPFFKDQVLQENLFLDGIHPNAEGHNILAETFVQAIQNLNTRLS